MAVVILGCKVLPSLARRIEVGVQIYKHLQRDASFMEQKVLIMVGPSSVGQTFNVATKMRDIAVESGIAEANVLLEDQGKNTVENAYFSKRVVDDLKINEIHLVSSEFHIPRNKMIFGNFFHKPCYNVYYHGTKEEITKEEKEAEDNEINMVDHNIHYCITDYGSKEKLLTFTSPVLLIDGFIHGFTTRIGGVSCYEPAASLNLLFKPSNRDPMIFVQENRRRVAAAIGINMKTAQCVRVAHQADVWVVGDPRPDYYDAIITDQAEVAIVTAFADCMSILLCDPVNHVIAAIHIGWPRSLRQIVSQVIEIMKMRFSCNPENMRAALGPSLGPCCYESVDVLFDDSDVTVREFIIANPEWKCPHLDLWGYLYITLQKYGLLEKNMDVPKPYHEKINPSVILFSSTVSRCTCCDPGKLFFSSTRDGPQFGCSLAIILMKSYSIRGLKSLL
ncbi:purine nucleoside phosphorylase LACC1-like isoform X1 [Corticium candelabrum]|uniref:purine nucleoside phosphorylase LACC1-like isoform X1 n=2 Tax=Corticium candelabrum TaxID=121492 RepID=UPI002E260AD5|nr:purine nucleoside phosphorylase LACC1-like isoform X1 [Corticium candelabrum]